MTTIPNEIAKRAIFVQEFRDVLENKNLFSPVATKLVADAKNIYSPFTSVEAAKSHTTPCVVPVSPLTLDQDELVLDRYVGNAITDCKDELSYANFDLIGMIRRDLYASVIKKNNILAAADFVADATSPGGTVDLSTAAKVAAFLIQVKADVDSASVGLTSSVDGARVVRAEKHGRPFIVAGTTAYVAIISQVASLATLSSLQGLADGNMIETPYGVTVINAGSAFADPKQMLYGVAGVPTMAYREDQVEVDMGEVTSVGTFDASSDDLDLAVGDAILTKTWYISAQTKGKNGIFSNVAALVKEQKMA